MNFSSSSHQNTQYFSIYNNDTNSHFTLEMIENPSKVQVQAGKKPLYLNYSNSTELDRLSEKSGADDPVIKPNKSKEKDKELNAYDKLSHKEKRLINKLITKVKKEISVPKLPKRITMSQNFRLTIFRGLLRVAIQCRNKNSTGFYIQIINIMKENNNQIQNNNIQGILDILVHYFERKMARMKKSNNMDFNNKDIEQFFYANDDEDPQTIFKKNLAVLFLTSFLDDRVFPFWVDEDCKSEIENKTFLKENIRQIRKVFLTRGSEEGQVTFCYNVKTASD